MVLFCITGGAGASLPRASPPQPRNALPLLARKHGRKKESVYLAVLRPWFYPRQAKGWGKGLHSNSRPFCRRVDWLSGLVPEVLVLVLLLLGCSGNGWFYPSIRSKGSHFLKRWALPSVPKILSRHLSLFLNSLSQCKSSN